MQQCSNHKWQLVIGIIASLFCLIFVLPWLLGLSGSSDEE